MTSDKINQGISLSEHFGLSLVEGNKSLSLDGNDLESDSGKISDGVAGPTESRNKNFIVIVDELESTIERTESGDLLVVFLELNTNTLSDSRVRLFGLDGNLRDNDALSVGSTLERLLPLRNVVRLVVALVVPALDSSLRRKLASCQDTTGLSDSHL